MILGFKKQFVPKILNGTKKHSIREDTKNRWNTGNKIHFATGVRTKNYHQFKEDICQGIQEIKIRWNDNVDFPQVTVWIDNALKFAVNGMIHNGTNFMNIFAQNDGFKDYDEFFQWFNRDFDGKIIHWTDFKYE